MTVNTIGSIAEFDTNGVTTSYPFYFKFLVNEDLVVTYINQFGISSVLTLGSQYSVNGAGSDTGGSVVTDGALAGPGKLIVSREMDPYQLTSLRNQGKFLAETHEDVFDRLTMLIQQGFGLLGRALLRPFGKDYYDAQNRNISNLKDPILDQDASTKRWSREYLSALIGAIQGPVNNALNIFFKGPDNLDYVVQDLSSTSVLAKGASLIGYRGRTVRRKLDDNLTVEDFGAIGDGVTDDKPAFLAMFSATGGYIRLLEKAYNVNGLTLTGSLVVIKSKAKPAYNATFTQLVGGSIMMGNVNIRAGQVDVRDLGIDAGSARGITAADGFVINAPVGGSGTKIVYRNNIVLGTNETSDSHATLIQGFNDHDIDGNDTALHQFGVVVKGRNGFITNTTGYRIRTAVVYPKSDIPAVGGDVADASVNTLIVDGVVSRANPANTTCNAVYVHASTLSLSNVTVSNVESTYGNAGLRIAGGSDTSIVPSGVTFNNIKSERAVCAVELFGYNYDTVGSNVRAINPTSGRAVQTSGNSFNYSITGIDLLISDPAIVSADAAQFNGTGLWDNFTVRNPYRVMTISSLLASVSNGNFAGDVKLAVEGNLTMASSWGSSGGHIPRLMMGPKNCIHLTGWAAPAVATGDQIAFLPFPLSDEKFFSCAARKTDGTYTSVIVYVAGTSITLMTTVRSTLTYVDLSGVTFYLR